MERSKRAFFSQRFKFLIFLIVLFVAFILRATLYFPQLSTEETRIAYRAYTLSETGKDELGRSWPVLFNSEEDYKLPVTSYLTALGTKFFGKNELGVRIPFVVLGTSLVLICYLITKSYTGSWQLGIYSAIMIALSPALIFLSKVPNDEVVLAFLTSLIFYLISKKQSNILVIVSLIILSMFVSKYSWFIMPFFVLLTSYFSQELPKPKRYFILCFSFITSVSAILIFLQIPQAGRSFLENNLTLVNDITIQNGIEKLRMQGIQSGWPPPVERVLFNKLAFVQVGILHWLSNISPNFYFGQLDKRGLLNFSSLGAFAKITILPIMLGIFYLYSKGNKRDRLLMVFILILTFPAALVYPKYSTELLIPTLPFMAIVASFGLLQLKQKLSVLIILLIFLELLFNILMFRPEIRYTNTIRPGWLKPVINDIYSSSLNSEVGVSDDIVTDIVPFISWWNDIKFPEDLSKIGVPYKYRQTSLRHIKLIGYDSSFYPCEKEKSTEFFLSSRDLEKISQNRPQDIFKSYTDSLGETKVSRIKNQVCIK